MFCVAPVGQSTAGSAGVCVWMLGVFVKQVRALTFTHINGSVDHLLERLGFVLPASSLNLAAMGLGQELESLETTQRHPRCYR